MTDRQFLESLLSQIDAYLAPVVEPPAPVDEVLSDWMLASAGEWGACQPGGTQQRTETWTRTVLVPASNGGIGGAPLSETRIGTQPCVYVPPVVDPPPAVEWPPTAPTEPLPGAKTGEGYPEKRVNISAQWHDSETQDIDNMRHMHIEAAVPEIVHTPIMRLDAFARLFHFQGGTFEGIRSMTMRTGTTAQKWMPTYLEGRRQGTREEFIPLGPDGHNVEFWTPIYLDLRTVTVPNWYTFEIDITVRRPDGRGAHARLIWKMFVDLSGNAVPTYHPTLRNSVHGEGWVTPAGNEATQFGYMTVTMWGVQRFVSDPALPITLVSTALVGRTVTLMLCKNPDLHQHPAHYGEVLFAQTFVSTGKESFTIHAPSLQIGDRLMARIVDASDPNIGSGATLAVVTLAKE